MTEEIDQVMSTKVIMPQMGESIVEGTIIKWLKKVGDAVKRDEPLFEISTDKVDSEIPAPESGTLQEILVPEGKTVQINTVVAVIGEAPAAAPQPPPVAEPVAAPPSAPAEQPALQEAAAVPEETAEAAVAREPERAPVPPRFVAPEATRAAGSSVDAREIRTSPLVRRLAREHGIDLSQLRGTGMSGRITRQDIERHLEGGVNAAAPAAAPAMPPRTTLPAPADTAGADRSAEAVAAPAAPAQSAPPSEAPAEPIRFSGEVETVPMTVMRKAIADHMVQSKHTSAHVHTVFQVDLTLVARLREKHREDFEGREGIRLTYTPFFVKALVDSVREFPILNCSVSGDSIVFKKAINVGVAVALESGLIVPVVRDAQLRSFTGLALAIHDLAERARSRKLKPEEVQDGTITVTNPGPFGSAFATPIINQPQVAILGVGGIEKRPVVVNDAIAIRSMVYLTLGFDHRVIDGAVADQFMAALKKRLESWDRWLE